MKATEWFIKLEYNSHNFFIPHRYVKDTEATSASIPEIFIDFDKIASDFFGCSLQAKHPAVINVCCQKKAMLATTSIPSVVQMDVGRFYVPDGVLKATGNNKGIIAVAFEDSKMSVIVNPEILYNSWNRKK